MTIVEDAITDLEKEETDTTLVKISSTLENSKPSRDKLFKNAELWSNYNLIPLIMILPTDKGKSTVIFKRQDYLEKCINHIKMVQINYLKKILQPKLKPRH